MSKADDRQKLQTAVSLQQKGNLNEAASLYREIIKANPDNFHAHHFLGVIEAGIGNLEQAKLLMARSLSIQPPNIQYIENYATILFQMGDCESALQICRQGLQLNDSSITLLYVSAIALFKLNRIQESITQFDKLLFLQPKHIVALNERGAALAEMEQYDAALASIEKATALDQRYAEAHLNKGNVYCALRRHDEAFDAYDKALSLKPDLADAWLGRGNVFCYLKRYDEAFGAYDRALALKPDLEGAWVGRGNAFYDLERYDEAFAAYDKVLATKPDFAEAWLGRGNVFAALNRDEEALQCYQKALALKNDLADAYFAMSMLELSRGEFKEGWALYEWRTRARVIPIRERLSDPAIEALGVSVRNTRSQITGKNIAVVSEQGVGDEIMFASMLPDVVNDAKSITYQIDPRLIRLASSSFPAVNFVSRIEPNYILSQKFDAIIRAGSFGYIYRPDAASFPRKPYLKADASIVDRWRSALGRSGQAYRIGISWRGGTGKTGRAHRSMTLDQLRPLLTRDDCMFVSLQYGDVRDEVEKYNEGAVRKIVHFPKDAIDDFDDLAGLIEALDIVVSVQNAVVHQCGALGKTCLAMLPWKAEWRYGKSGSQMVWYSSVELFRQSEKGNWGDVLAAVNSRLSAEMIKARECAQ